MMAASDLSTTLGGVRLPFCAMNVAGVCASSSVELRTLAASGTGAIVMRTATVHPFVHPEYRTLHNPGYDRLVPLVRELADAAGPPVVASIAGTTAAECVLLARAFADAGAALVEANLAEPYVIATLAPFDSPDALRAILEPLVAACQVPVAIRLPERVGLGYASVGDALAAAGLRIVVIRNDFSGFERFQLETRRAFEVVAAGAVRSGYDVSRALVKGARAVQLGSVLTAEGPRVFARLAHEMRTARGER